nr:MucR family transcriptional regulator [Rhodoligotrophos appendicifer]
MDETNDEPQVELTAQIVSAYVAKNSVQLNDLPSLIASVHKALSGLSTDGAAEPVTLTPAVPVKKSVTHEFIVCLEDGKKFKSLKRHLSTHYNLTPEQYRAKWQLPPDYPMVAPAYAEARSNLARALGLGRKPNPTSEASTPTAAKSKSKAAGATKDAN